MSLIDPGKKYKKLIAFGCSFTTGFTEGENSSWGCVLSKMLECDYEIRSGNGSSNYVILSRILDYCESNDMSDCCVGIQWSNPDRREIWIRDEIKYFSFGNHRPDGWKSDEFAFMENNFDFFRKTIFDDREILIRNSTFITSAINYLQNKNIDFIMFEGLNSIRHMGIDPQKSLHVEMGNLISESFVKNLLQNKHFFTKHGDMWNCSKEHELFDEQANGGHPNLKFVEWWCSELYDYLLKNSGE